MQISMDLITAKLKFLLNERPEIDRWILSELNTLIKTVDEAYADYEPTKAARAISDFVQENLSNWYVRLCRRRFWKGEYAQDKIAAYQTLYTCLTTVAKLSCTNCSVLYGQALQRFNTGNCKRII